MVHKHSLLKGAGSVCIFLSLSACRDQARPPSGNVDRSEDLSATSTTNPPGQVTIQAASNSSNWQETDNAAEDGWASEAFDLDAHSQLKRLGTILTRPAEPLGKDSLFSSKIRIEQNGDLKNSETEALPAKISRTHSSPSPEPKLLGQGIDSCLAKLSDRYHWLQSPGAEFEFKTISHDLRNPGEVSSRVLAAFKGSSPKDRIEQHESWLIKWLVTPDAPPRLSKIHIESSERSHLPGRLLPLFSDQTPAAFRGDASYPAHILRDASENMKLFPMLLEMDIVCLRGFALGDVNGDGLEDLYLCEDTGLPNRLYLRQNDGSLKEASKDWGVDWLEDSRSALLIDLDNDGDQDLCLGVHRNLVIASNEDQKGFRVRAVLPCSDSVTHLAATDYDLDGRIDLYVGTYNPHELLKDRKNQFAVGSGPFVIYDANTGGRNSLFKNDIAESKWQFRDVTEALGLDTNNRRFTFAASWEDFDNDGDQDLYVGNDFGKNNLYRHDRNDQGQSTFVDVAKLSAAEDQSSAMSVAWADYDRDGLMDIMIANMWSSAGKRIITQDQFKPNLSLEMKSAYARLARGNSLLKNLGHGQMRDVSEECGIRKGRWAWGAPLLDINNDGWEDLFVANGYVTGVPDSGDL